MGGRYGAGMFARPWNRRRTGVFRRCRALFIETAASCAPQQDEAQIINIIYSFFHQPLRGTNVQHVPLHPSFWKTCVVATLPINACPVLYHTSFARYFDGKKRAEEAIAKSFPSSGVLIKPTFIYGGDSFGLTPPRVSDGYGSGIDSLLSSGPIRAIAGISPGLIKVCVA